MPWNIHNGTPSIVWCLGEPLLQFTNDHYTTRGQSWPKANLRHNCMSPVPICSPSRKRTDTLPAAVTRISSSDFGSSSWSYFWRTHQAQAYHHNQNERKKWEESNDISLKSKPLPIIVIHVHCGYGRPNLSKMKMAHNTNVCNVVYKQTMKHSHCRTSSFITTSSLSTYICKSQQKG